MVNATNNIENFRPMLSASLPCMKGEDLPTQEEVIQDLKRWDWSNGIYASPKIDGIRAVCSPAMGPVSRTLKSIPNRFIREALSSSAFHYMDGELIAGTILQGLSYNECQSQIMSEAGNAVFTYCVFDDVEFPQNRFSWRNERLFNRIEALGTQGICEYGGATFYVKWLEQKVVRSIDELLQYEEECIAEGYEGVILRHPLQGYKNGRATFKQMGMLKLKRFLDGEAVITGFQELYRNTNTATTDALGYTKRSAHLAGMVPAGTLGLLELKGITGLFDGVGFECGSGLDDSLRDAIWSSREQYLGRIVKYKFQPHGVKDKPRAPIFLGFRSGQDMG